MAQHWIATRPGDLDVFLLEEYDTACTASEMLHVTEVGEGDTVGVHSASGAVGVSVLQQAVAARSDPVFVLIARTDARAVDGLDGALERAAAYRHAGADVLFIEAPESESEVAAIAEAFPEVPLLFNWVERGRSPMLPLDRIAALGFALVIMPVTTLFSDTAAMERYLEEIRLRGTPLGLLDDAIDFEELGELMSLPAIRSLEEPILGVDA